MRIIPNEYLDLTIICDQCCFPVTNAKTRLAKRCCMPGIFHPKNKSSCQKSADRTSAKKARQDALKREDGKFYQNRAFEDKSQEAMRECLKCDVDEEGVAPKFLSRNPYHRICDSCSNTIPGINMKNLSGLARTLPNLEHITIV